MYLRIGDYIYKLVATTVHPDDTVYFDPDPDRNPDRVVSLSPLEGHEPMTLYDFMEEMGFSEDPDRWDEGIETLEEWGVWEYV